MVKERTTRRADGGEQLIKRVSRPQGINQLRFLPVRQERLVDAQIFFNSVSSPHNLTQGQQLGVDPPLVAVALFREGNAGETVDLSGDSLP